MYVCISINVIFHNIFITLCHNFHFKVMYTIVIDKVWINYEISHRGEDETRCLGIYRHITSDNTLWERRKIISNSLLFVTNSIFNSANHYTTLLQQTITLHYFSKPLHYTNSANHYTTLIQQTITLHYFSKPLHYTNSANHYITLIQQTITLH